MDVRSGGVQGAQARHDRQQRFNNRRERPKRKVFVSTTSTSTRVGQHPLAKTCATCGVSYTVRSSILDVSRLCCASSSLVCFQSKWRRLRNVEALASTAAEAAAPKYQCTACYLYFRSKGETAAPRNRPVSQTAPQADEVPYVGFETSEVLTPMRIPHRTAQILNFERCTGLWRARVRRLRIVGT
jgi:hypothetical protein